MLGRLVRRVFSQTAAPQAAHAAAEPLAVRWEAPHLFNAMAGSLYKYGFVSMDQFVNHKQLTDTVFQEGKRFLADRQLSKVDLAESDAITNMPQLMVLTKCMAKQISTELDARFENMNLDTELFRAELCKINTEYDIPETMDNPAVHENDMTKLSLMYFINRVYRPQMGGQTRLIFYRGSSDPDAESEIERLELDVQPLNDRLLGFWSDTQAYEAVKSVNPNLLVLKIWLYVKNDPSWINAMVNSEGFETFPGAKLSARQPLKSLPFLDPPTEVVGDIIVAPSTEEMEILLKKERENQT